jgi:PPP family 3-phenylpropionic acid transporter
MESPTSQRDLWLTRLYYFVYFGGLGFASPFLNLFYVRLGFSGTEIGWTLTIASIVGLVAAPVITSQNTRWRNPRAVLQLTLFFGGMSYLWLSQQTAFWGVLVVIFFRSLLVSGVWPLSDALALSVTQRAQKGFGSVRMWASAGWVVWVLLSGWLIEQTSTKTGLIGSGICALVSVGIVYFIRSENFLTPRTPQRSSFRDTLHYVLHDRAMIGVGMTLLFIGVLNNGVLQFEGVYLDTLGAPETIIGVAGMLGAVVEVPFMLWSDRLVERYGAHKLLLTSLALNALLRLSVFSAPSVAMIMVGKAIGGISFSFYVIGLIKFISERSAPEQTRTVLALYNMTLASLIGIAAPPMVGRAYDLWGARWLYLAAFVGYILGWVCLYWTGSKGGVSDGARAG